MNDEWSEVNNGGVNTDLHVSLILKNHGHKNTR